MLADNGRHGVRPSCDRHCIHARTHARIILQLPAAHALTGCDTVAQLWGRGKAACKKIMESGRPLDKLGDATADIGDVMSEATAFVAACYGSK